MNFVHTWKYLIDVTAIGGCFTYHGVERVVGMQSADFMSFEYVQHALRSPADEEHTNDRQQHANHLRTSWRSFSV